MINVVDQSRKNTRELGQGVTCNSVGMVMQTGALIQVGRSDNATEQLYCTHVHMRRMLEIVKTILLVHRSDARDIFAESVIRETIIRFSAGTNAGHLGENHWGLTY